MEPVKRIKREIREKGSILTLYKDTVVVNGVEAEWDYIHHGGAAAVVAVNDEGKLLMVRQYRNALDRDVLEIPAGKLDSENEPTIECAKRELEEETGYQAEEMMYLLTINTAVAFCNEKIDIYLARNLKKTQQNLDPDEIVEVELWDLEDLKELIYKGELTDAKTISAILTYETKCLRS